MKGPVPPFTVISIAPVVAPLQSILVFTFEMVNPDTGWETVALSWPIHPFKSVTVTLYIPAEIAFKSSLVELLDQTKVYGLVPPETLKSTLPVEFPLQSMLVTPEDSTKAVGWVKVVV